MQGRLCPGGAGDGGSRTSGQEPLGRQLLATGVYLGAFLASVEAVSHWNLAVLVSAAYVDHVVAMPVIAGLLHLISTTLSGSRSDRNVSLPLLKSSRASIAAG